MIDLRIAALDAALKCTAGVADAKLVVGIAAAFEDFLTGAYHQRQQNEARLELQKHMIEHMEDVQGGRR